MTKNIVIAFLGLCLSSIGFAEDASYRIDSITYSGPQPAAPFYLRIVGGEKIFQSESPNCDVNKLFSKSLGDWSQKTGSKPYRLSDMTLSFDQSAVGKCGKNETSIGKLVVGYSSAEGVKNQKSFCGTCPMGMVATCLNHLLYAAIAVMNGGRETANTACPK